MLKAHWRNRHKTCWLQQDIYDESIKGHIFILQGGQHQVCQETRENRVWEKQKWLIPCSACLELWVQVGQQVATETEHAGRMHVAKHLTGILKHLNLNNVTETVQYEIESFSFPRKAHFYRSLRSNWRIQAPYLRPHNIQQFPAWWSINLNDKKITFFL